jgi:hypothetical protein
VIGVDVRRQLQSSKSPIEIAKSVAHLEELLGGNLVYSGYPYDPYVASSRH